MSTVRVSGRPPRLPAALPQPVARAWTNPELLRAGLISIWVASLLLMVTAIVGAQSHLHAMKVIGHDTAPEIIAAQHMRAALADMDADAANELLVGGTSRKAYDDRNDEVISSLLDAAGHISFESERKPLHDLALGIGTYTAGIQTARDRRDAGTSFLDPWRHAAQFMDTKLLPAAGELDRADRNALDAAYLAQASASVQASVLLILSGLLLGGVLIAVQVMLSGRMRRTFNPMLLLATLCTLVFLVYSGQQFAASSRELSVAKQEAFESIHWLWRARALAYSANSDESRYLLDPAHGAEYEKLFREEMDAIAFWPDGAAAGDAPQAGLLANELHNITFAGERVSADEMVRLLVEYRRLDREIRALQAAGKHSEAIALFTDPKELGGVFQAFDGALGSTLDINQRAFDAAIAHGEADVSRFEVTAPLAALVISLLGWLGLRPRLREYSA